MSTIIIDAGHGGLDQGAMYHGRKEKNDTLNLALNLGEMLIEDGYPVEYTRTEDVYQSPFEKAQLGNMAGGDLFLSVHRNFGDDGGENGVSAYVFKKGGVADKAAEEILSRLEKLGFENEGVFVKNGLAVLKRTTMPAVLLEVGYINSEKDNDLFDTKFNQIADAVSDAIKQVFPQETADAQPGTLKKQEEDGEDCNQETEDSRESGCDTEDSDSKEKECGTQDSLKDECDTEENSRREETSGEQNYRNAGTAGNPGKFMDEDMETRMKNSIISNAGDGTEDCTDDEESGGQMENKEVNGQKEPKAEKEYWVQTGIFKYAENAMYQQEILIEEGYPAMICAYEGRSWKVVKVGPYTCLEDAAIVQSCLRDEGFETLIVT